MNEIQINEIQINRKLVKSFLDIIIMALMSGTSTHGYAILASVHREFGILLSPGTLYPLLHALEDKELISSSPNNGKVVYKISIKGKQKFESTLNAFNKGVQKLSNFIKRNSEEVVLTV